MGTITKVDDIVWVNYGSGMAQRLGTDVEIIAFNGGITNTDDVPYNIIKKAIKDYPKGITFKSMLHDSEAISNGILKLVDSGKNIICDCINDCYRYVYYNDEWAEIITQHKFKIGDKVKVITSGSGCGVDELNKIVTITDIGIYHSQTGYKVSPAIGNSETGCYAGFIGESSFELVIDKTPTLADALQVGKYYLVKHKYNDEVIILVDSIADNYPVDKGNLAVFGHDIYLNVGQYYDNTSWCEVKKVIREATPEEIEWLDACIKAEKFVPQSELKKSNVDRCNLIQGEYYHIIDDIDCHWIVKFNKVINELLYVYKAIIIPKNRYYKGGSWGGFANIKSIYNATNDEISFFRFCEKANTFLKQNEYYKVICNSDNQYIIQFDKIENDNIYTINDSYNLKDKGYSRFKAVVNFAEILKIEKASPTEIKLLTDKRFGSTTETLYMEPLKLTISKDDWNKLHDLEERFLKNKTSTEHLEIKQNNLFNVPKI